MLKMNGKDLDKKYYENSESAEYICQINTIDARLEIIRLEVSRLQIARTVFSNSLGKFIEDDVESSTED